MREKIQDRKLSELKLDIPSYTQSAYECGPNSLYMVLSSEEDQNTNYSEIKSMAYSPKVKGSRPTDMVGAARRLGHAPYKVHIDDFLDYLESGYPIITFHNYGTKWFPVYHYNVLTGYNKNDKKFFVHDGRNAHHPMKIKRFVQSWTRGGEWSYTYVKPQIIPPKARYEEVLTNGLVLNKLDYKEEAFKLFKSTKEKWPHRYEAYLALANLYYENKNYKEADKHIIAAIEREPQNPILYYNHALINKSLNRKALALASIAKGKEINNSGLQNKALAEKLEAIY